MWNETVDGMIFQSAALFDSLNVLENVMFPLDMFSTMNYRERVKRAQECLDRVNLIEAQQKYPGEISGGYFWVEIKNNSYLL